MTTQAEASAAGANATEDALLRLVFLVSGFAAILYQVVWQRTLFAVVGINVEAATLIVTAFILGLGLGSLAGGRLSRAEPRGLILRFAAVEAGIGGFGLISLPLLHAVGRWTLGLPPAATAVIVFGAILPPTMGMGATLPILVAYHVRRFGNVGSAVGGLYFINTLGSALAALVAAYSLMRVLGQTRVVWLAAACNLAVATTVAVGLRAKARRS